MAGEVFDEELKRRIVLAAVETVDADGCKSVEEYDRKVTYRAVTISDFMRQRSLPMKVLGSVRLYGTAYSVEFQETSKRYIVGFHASNSDDGEVELISSPRMDSDLGRDIAPLVEQLKQRTADGQGVKVVLYKNNEMPSKKAREEGGSKVPANGYRVFVWLDIRG